MLRIHEVIPLRSKPNVTIIVPGSKSITNRALILAALSTHDLLSASTLDNALDSEDTSVMVSALTRLGFRIEVDNTKRQITVPVTPVDRWNPSAELYCGNSGTTIRFLTAMLSLGEGTYRLDGVERMHQRPIADLLHALQQLGVNIESEHKNGCPPVILKAKGLTGGKVKLQGDVSSQFLSALLMAAPLASGDVEIELTSQLVSVPYVEMTLAMMREFGATVHVDWKQGRFQIPGGQTYQARRYEIEPDASAASYFLAAAAITGGVVRVHRPNVTLQGDWLFQDLLVRMGCQRTEDGQGIRGGNLTGIDVDMNAISDTVMTLAVVALFASGPTTIRNIAHIRHKETDRIAALACELRKVGAEIQELPDGLVIHPKPLRAATFRTYDDHRMAMSLALIGLVVPGIQIENPNCVSKTYPGFWLDLNKLYA